MNLKLLLPLIIMGNTLIYSMEHESKEPLESGKLLSQIIAEKRKALEKVAASTGSGATLATAITTTPSTGSSSSVGSGIPAPSKDASPLKRCIQLSVQRQEGADCGYHAIKNALLITRYINSPDLLKFLNSPDYVTPIFRTMDTPWKAEVINIRAKRIADNKIRKIFNDLIKALPQTPELNSVKNVITDSTKALIIAHGETVMPRPGHDGFFYINIKVPTIIDTFFSIIKQKALVSPELPYKNITRSMLEGYFARLKPILFSIVNDTIIREPGLPDQIYSWPRSASRGDWLQSDEIDRLIELEKEREGSIFPFTATKIIHTIESSAASSKEVFAMQENYTKLSAMVKDISNGVALEALVVSLDRHWVTLVVNKQKGLPAQYILADSLGGNLKDDQLICNIIGFLEGKAVIRESLGSSKSSASMGRLAVGTILTALALTTYSFIKKTHIAPKKTEKST